MDIKLVPFCFEHLDLFYWKPIDYEMYNVNSEFIQVFLSEAIEAYTLICDGRILCIGGVIKQTEKTGFCFTIISKYAEQHKFAVAKTVKRMLLNMFDDMGFHRLTTYNRVEAEEHHKWCEWLGFKFAGIDEKYDDEGNDYKRYVLVR